MNNVQTKVIAKHIQNLLCFVETQQAVVDEYASQVFTDSAVQQHCGYGGIHTTREAEDDFIVAYLLADASYSIVDNFRWRPQGFTLADITHKTLQHAHTLAGVSHFRVELYAIEAFFFVSHNGKRAAFGAGYGDEVGRDSGNFIAVAHPDIEQRFTVCGQSIFNTANQCAVVYDFNLRVAKFTFVRGFNVTAQLHCHGLHAIANAEYRYACFKNILRRTRAVFFGGAFRAAGKNNAAWVEVTNLCFCHIPRPQFAVNTQFTHAARNQLSVLRTEVQNEDAMLMNVFRH